MAPILCLLLLLGVRRSEAMKEDHISVDLRYGLVTGYSPFVSFLQTPSAAPPTATQTCAGQAVVKVQLGGLYKGVRLELDYGESPRLWTLDIADSPVGDGYGGDNGTGTNTSMAEAHVLNRQLRVYGNGLPGYIDASLNGGHLLHIMDDIVKKGSRLWLDISDGRLEIGSARGATLQNFESPYLFSLGKDHRPGGGRSVYIGLNRVVAGTRDRVGSGLCKADISLYELGVCVT